MTAFEDREKSYEARWAHDEDLRFRALSRRNKLLGLWAARKMGLVGAAADSYAKGLLELEVRGGGENEIADKIHNDFAAHRIALSKHAVHRKMEEFLLEAAEQVMRETKS